MKKLKFLFFPTILVLAFGLMLSCSKSSSDNSSSSDSSSSSDLASTVISELSANLSSSSSSRQARVSSRSTSKTLSNSLTSSQISQVVDAATAAVTASSLDSSEDLIQIMPKIIEGSQGKLATVGLSNSSETIKVINVIGNSLVKSISGRSANLPSTSAESGSTATETVLKKITSTSVANLDEAGLSPTDIGNASSELVETVVGSLGSGGLSSTELGGAIDKITAGAVGSLDQITGFSVSSLGDAIDNITSGATAALGDITVSGYSADDLSTMVEKVTSGATSALGNISMTGYSSDNLSSMVEKVTSGATSALGKIEMTGYDSSKLTSMVEKVTSGATSALGKIEMTGYSSDNLALMVEKVTSGATGALGKISMTGYSSDILSTMVAEVTFGATAALGNIVMTGYDAADLSGMLTKISAGATGALGKIEMDDYDYNDLAVMVSKITSGATEALGKIEMTGYSSDNITSLTSTITTSTTNSLGNIKMEGFDKDNIPSDITNGITTGSNAGILMQPPMIKEITVVTTPTKDNRPSYTFKSSKAGTISYRGNCRSYDTNATIGNNTITFSTLSDGTYSNCKLYVTSSTGVKGNVLSVTPFTVDTSSNNSSGGGDSSGSGGGSSYSCSFKNTKAFIVGNAVTEKCIFYDCPKSKIVIWDLNGCMKVVGESVMGAVDAASHNNSIYIADDAGYYWIVGAGNKIEKKKINNSSGSEITGISVNSVGNVYVAGNVVKNKKEYTAYWKNGELVKTFRENAAWYSEKHVAADSNGNVYIPGWRMKSHSVTYSAYWKNGNLKKLTSSLDGEATDVDVSGSNIYFSGAHGHYNRGILAAYWQVGKGMTKVTKVKTHGLPKNMVWSSRASSIHVEGSTVYMAGSVNVINAGNVPVYWKKKTQHELPVEFNLETCDMCKADPTDISLLDSKPLVVGDYYNEKDFVDASHTNGETKAVYWHDKKLHKLCECCGTSRAIAVVANECVGTSCEQAEWEDRTCSTSSETKDDKVFTKQLGSSGEDLAKGVAVDSSNNIYVTGYTDGGLDGNTSSGKKDFFLTKYNSSGTKEWTKQQGSSGDDFGNGVAVDSSDNIYVTGATYGKLHGNKNSGIYDIFLVKYNSSGIRQWTEQLGTSTVEHAYAVTTDSSDNIYVTGITWGGLDGSAKPSYCNKATVKASNECTDIFLVKYNSSGTKQWVKQLEGSSSKSYEKSQGLAVDSSDNIYVTGYTVGGLDGNTSSGSSDIFLVKYNQSGSKQWTKQLGTNSSDGGSGVTTDS